MDMTVANLFKHKALFQMDSPRGSDDNHPDHRRFHRGYISKNIENARSIGVTDINELCLKCLEPFMVYIISQLVTEETEHIDFISVYAELFENDPFNEDGHNIMSISLDNPKFCLHVLSSNSESTIYSFQERLLDRPFFIMVSALFGFMTPLAREMEVRIWVESMRSRGEEEEEEQYTPPDETYKQDLCVICLENTPNILYLECNHIAVCDSCDRMKRTMTLRSTCDVCRVEISRRLKI